MIIPISYVGGMARHREFDIDTAVEAAIGVFREHGFEGSSAQMLVAAMGIGRQSLYDTFGDKWGIYLAAVKRYSDDEVRAHAAALDSRERAVDGIRAMFDRVVAEAGLGCLGVSSTVEFGCSRPDLVEARAASGAWLAKRIEQTLMLARDQGDLAPTLNIGEVAAFLVATIASIRLAARAGADEVQTSALVTLAMRALA
jgi:TetR/AcrR family transcriptional regulator, transcriptional repressor for nem operon